MIGTGAVLTVFSLAMVVLARRKQKRVAAWQRIVDGVRAPGGDHAAAHAGTLEALRCATCGAPVPLVDAGEVRCACGAMVPVPPAYVQLCAARRQIAERLPHEAAVLRRARAISHPLVGAAMIAAAYPAYHAFGALMRLGLGGGGDDTGTAIAVVAGFPLVLLPIALIAAGIGQLLGSRKLATAMPALAAVKTEHGYACRGCGAPLPEAASPGSAGARSAAEGPRAGIADGACLCMYCGVQNVIAARLAATAVHERGVAGALAASISAATAEFWATYWRLLIPPLYVLGVVGLFLDPLLLAIGFAS
jgi:hypothetical protein